MIYLWILKTKYLYIIAMATDACWVGHLWNQAFLCRTMYFCVEPGFLCRTSVIIWYTNCLCTSIYNDIYKYSLANKMHLGENNKTTQYIIQYPGRKKRKKSEGMYTFTMCTQLYSKNDFSSALRWIYWTSKDDSCIFSCVMIYVWPEYEIRSIMYN